MISIRDVLPTDNLTLFPDQTVISVIGVVGITNSTWLSAPQLQNDRTMRVLELQELVAVHTLVTGTDR